MQSFSTKKKSNSLIQSQSKNVNSQAMVASINYNRIKYCSEGSSELRKRKLLFKNVINTKFLSRLCEWIPIPKFDCFSLSKRV